MTSILGTLDNRGGAYTLISTPTPFDNFFFFFFVAIPTTRETLAQSHVLQHRLISQITNSESKMQLKVETTAILNLDPYFL